MERSPKPVEADEVERLPLALQDLGGGTQRFSRPKQTSSRTRVLMICASGSWNTMPTSVAKLAIFVDSDRLAADRDLAFELAFQCGTVAVQELQQRALAASARTEDQHELAVARRSGATLRRTASLARRR